MNFKSLLSAVVAVLVLLVALDGFFIVHQTERAIVLRFGAVTRADVPAGFHFKIPFAEKAIKFDGRIITLDAAPQTYYTLEKKPLLVDSFAKWRVADVLSFYKATTGQQSTAELILGQRVDEGLRNQISRRDMHEVISGERDLLMSELTAELNAVMRENLGVEVVDVRTKRIDLPPEVSRGVYDRMESERAILARQYRAQGDELAIGIRADADRQTVVVAANAYKESEQIRGDGDASSASIYADAFNRDPEFYAFYRSINAYTEVFADKGDLMILDPESDFFKYLKSESGG